MEVKQTVIVMLMLAFISVGCGGINGPVAPDSKRQPENALIEQDSIALPGPSDRTGAVEEAIFQRRSRRDFSTKALELAAVERLLWSAGGLSVDGVTGPTRAIPSAGATYPLDVYLVADNVEGLEPGIYHYNHLDGRLERVMSGDYRGRVAEAALGQGFIADAPAVIVLVAHFERTTRRYGERGERYVYMDAGYASQNIYLMAGELGMVTVAVGAFTDPAVADAIGTTGVPLLIMPVGYPSL